MPLESAENFAKNRYKLESRDFEKLHELTELGLVVNTPDREQNLNCLSNSTEGTPTRHSSVEALSTCEWNLKYLEVAPGITLPVPAQ
jgi:hypothetical protein